MARRNEVKEAGPRPLSYEEALAWLYSLERFGIKLGLENIRRLIDSLQINFGQRRIIHVAGTNGKGSVCAMIDVIARAQGHRTGLFVSPHLITFRERIRINGKMISKVAVADGLFAIRKLVGNWKTHPTFFEVTTALALKCFSQAPIDLVILETGLGGRLDATNAVPSDVSVITSIALDHQKWLGDSLEAIATEKAGIIKPKMAVVSGAQKKEVEAVLREHAAKCEAPIEFVTASYELSPLALRGAHQKQNAAIAIAALRAAKIDLDDSAVARGLMSVEWPARFQRWDERTIIDGAHNPAAAHILGETWREVFGDQKATVILAILSDKDLRGICQALTSISDHVFLPKIRSERATDPSAIAAVLSSIAPSLPCSITPSIADAIDGARARQKPILLTGSLHFAGEALAHLRGEPAAFEECAQ